MSDTPKFVRMPVIGRPPGLRPGASANKYLFAIQHLIGAAACARTCAQLEGDGTTEDGKAIRLSVAYAAVAVQSTVAWLECSINELFGAAIDGDMDVFAQGPPHLPRLMSTVWEAIEGAPVLSKYDAVINLASLEPFDRGAKPFQDVAQLVRLRNAIVHHKPEWDFEVGDHKKLESQLARSFAPNRLVPTEWSYFPHRCLGAGCAVWAVDSARGFTAEFARRLSLPLVLDRYGPEISPR